MTQTQQFYDGIAQHYTGIFVDWHTMVLWQADILQNLLSQYSIEAPADILDCTCGIGTQAFALATKGYRLHGSDLSPEAIKQAKNYAGQFEISVPISFSVANLLETPANPVQYDAVLAFDNAVAHLDSPDEFLTAIETMKLQVKRGGRIFISLRDYDAMSEQRPQQTDLRIKETESGRQIMFQVLDWDDDGTGYQSEMFVITRSGDSWQTISEKTRMIAWQRADVTGFLEDSALTDIQWHMPEESGFYQPIVSAIRPKF